MGVTVKRFDRLRWVLAPGTLAFSVDSLARPCPKHLLEPYRLLRGYGIARNGMILFPPGGSRSLAHLAADNNLYLVNDSICQIDGSHSLNDGDVVAAFSKRCECVAYPFRLISPAWPATNGITAVRTDTEDRSSIGLTRNPAGLLVVQAGWNLPVNPAVLSAGDSVWACRLWTGTYEKRKFVSASPGSIQLLGPEGFDYIDPRIVGHSLWLFRDPQ